MNNKKIYNIVSKYIHNQTDENIKHMYVELLQHLQDIRALQTGTFADEDDLHEDVEEIQNTINIILNNF